MTVPNERDAKIAATKCRFCGKEGVGEKTGRCLVCGAVQDAATTDKQPCSGCGYMMRGGSMCGDCRNYGPPRGWRWEYDPETGKHKQVGSFITPPPMP